MSGLDPQQRAQRERGLCEREEGFCPERATLIVSPYGSPIDSRRFCQAHGEPFRTDPAYHVAAIAGLR
jgi:hypothetical protein